MPRTGVSSGGIHAGDGLSAAAAVAGAGVGSEGGRMGPTDAERGAGLEAMLAAAAIGTERHVAVGVALGGGAVHMASEHVSQMS